ncbi:hypothetical protein OBBRIDRAFT_767184 [Obba rivulosa]|uniref:ER-golgi trafficking TRAPP I complex 85 kDa subunit-domain-containing protein n=1 Tax=Obba rivulosa TaxID=1052685 RepID=A0A8E2DU41_9APHY|nr:hypothetical protein OBBRIDRAFT_767184 [Obba rivulosa]
MAPTLPSSLSPHICILASPDLQELLESCALPPLHQILQCFAPLSQGRFTTRTTTLTSVPHSHFAIRFSDLKEIETATHEDEEQRAGRTLDWIGARIASRSTRWVELVEGEAASGKGGVWQDRTPWWEEVKRCIEGDHVPTTSEGWNHPTAIIFATSTAAANPLQALHDLQSRSIDLPPWVDNTHLRYNLIVHPSNSPLTEPIAESLFNAVKKQYGLHSYLLPLSIPTPAPPPSVSAPSPLPRLPPPPTFDSPPLIARPDPVGLAALSTRGGESPVLRSPDPQAVPNQHEPPPSPIPPSASVLRLPEADINRTGKFVRDFVTMSLIPWMEKCVVDWNEQYSSSRRLPSRLFSSTRRLFGSGYTPSGASSASITSHGSNTSTSSSARFTHTSNSSVSSVASTSSLGHAGGSGVTQQRRLAEFATILGDYKLATSVWESLRKEGRGGSEILPLLLSPSPALALHAAHALSTLRSSAQVYQSTEAPANVQLRALVYAVRWDIGIDKRDFLSPILEGERWLVQAAGSAEEPPSALLLAHAAFLSEKAGSRRRSALWYLFSADRLERAGIKPLAMYLFRKAHELFETPPSKNISPSFWEGEGIDEKDRQGFDAVLPAIEHELGRLLYTTGNTQGAVYYFLELLRPPTPYNPPHYAVTAANGMALMESKQSSSNKVYLEDLRVTLKHFKATEPDKWEGAALKLPLTFCQVKETRIRFPGDTIEGDAAEWEKRESAWSTFWSTQGKEKLEKSGKAAVDEAFWVDLVLRNPLDVEVVLSGFTLAVKEAGSEEISPAEDLAEIEVIDDIVLGGKEIRTIPVAIKCKRPASLVIVHAIYDFLSLLPATESLAVRGRRLHDTPHQRQNKVYAPDILIKVDVEETGQRIHANFVDDRHMALAHGECKPLSLNVTNSGTLTINELWIVADDEDEVWIHQNADSQDPSTSKASEVLHSSNSLAPATPIRISIDELHQSPGLAPGESLQIPILLHAARSGEQDLSFLFVFREAGSSSFHCARVTRRYEVRPFIQIGASSRPGRSAENPFVLNVDVENVVTSSTLRITQITTMSPTWSCNAVAAESLALLAPQQVARLAFHAKPWNRSFDPEEVTQFVSRKLASVLQGEKVDPSEPPLIDILCNHYTTDESIHSILAPAIRHFIHSNRRIHVAHSTAAAHPHIPANTHRSIFPLYHPSSVDILVFWESPAQDRSGFVLLPGIMLGAGHAPLQEIINTAENTKAKRSMYAETHRERHEILQAVKNCEWNAEMDPVVVAVQDGAEVAHDFTKGPCHAPVAFTLRNLSLTNPCRVTLRLSAAHPHGTELSSLLPPHYAGRLTHRAVLAPSESVTMHAKLWVTRPGCYALDCWTVETEVGECLPPLSASADTTQILNAHSTGGWRSRGLRYIQSPPGGDVACITVTDISRS